MLPVLRVAAKGEIRISDAVEKLSAEFGLSPEERSQLLPSGRQTTFSNRVHWAKSYLGKAGLVELTKRAYFRITDLGREVIATSPETHRHQVFEPFSRLPAISGSFGRQG
jgi:restriction system protein